MGADHHECQMKWGCSRCAEQNAARAGSEDLPAPPSAFPLSSLLRVPLYLPAWSHGRALLAVSWHIFLSL